MEYVIKGHEHDLVLKPKPNMRKLYIELTTHCNYDCPFCFRNTFREELGMMNLDTLHRIFEDVSDFPELEWIVFGGIGEPMTHPNFREAVTYFADKGYKTMITTNGGLIDDKAIDCLIEHGVNKLSISLDFSEIGHPNADQTIQIIKKINREVERRLAGKPVVAVELVLSTQNIHHLPKLAPLLIDIGITEVIVSNLLPIHPMLNQFVLYDKKFDRYKHYFDEFLSRVTGWLAIDVPNFELLTERHCNFIESNAAVIRWDGEVFPCYRLMHDAVEYIYGRRKEIHAHSFGNINNQSLKSIWMSKDYTYFRYKVRNALFPSCTDCKFKDVCQFVDTTEVDCWGNEPSCADCLWWRGILICP